MNEVRVEQGIVSGASEDGIHRFLGLPFAAPPVGDLRWRPPAPPAPWDGVRDATVFGGAAVQIVDTGHDLRAPESEDCLYLNVWTTTLDQSARRPVMVWIHGGGFLNGAGSWPGFDGTDLARENVVVVTVNYRLGAFGFLAHPEFGANFAVLDWVAALAWVAENIAAFGGDPGNVTVFGQSAGAAAVRTLLSTPSARGRFHRAIIQSAGFEHYASVASPSFERVARASEELLDRLGTRDPRELREVPTDKVREASLALSGIFPPEGQVHTPANLVWYPVADDAVVAGEGFPGWPSEVPVMLGCVDNEARFFVRPSMIYAHEELDPSKVYTQETLEHMVRALGGDRAADILEYFAGSGLTPYEALDEVYSTAIWFEPALATLARFGTLGREVFAYRFGRVSPGAARSGELVAHAAENAYVFGRLEPAENYDDTDVKVSAELQHAWAVFARTGVPASLDGSAWPQYDPAAPRQAVVEDVTRDLPLTPSRVTELIHSLRSA